MAASWTERLHRSTGSDKPKLPRQEVDDVRINSWSAYALPPWGGAGADRAERGGGADALIRGCFWHRHEGCSLARSPKTRLDYWEPKLASNVARDLRVAEPLQSAGWARVIIWECQTLCLCAVAGRYSYIRSPIRQRFDRASRAGKHSRHSLARIPPRSLNWVGSSWKAKCARRQKSPKRVDMVKDGRAANA